jgi:hypothetical protein
MANIIDLLFSNSLISNLFVYVIWSIIIMYIYKVSHGESYQSLIIHICAYITISIMMFLISSIIILGFLSDLVICYGRL